jgi:hypothetical protein
MRIDNKLFNPASQPKEWLIERFVVRTKVFEKIFKDIHKGDMKYPEQHYLIQGLRGMGKTTLLLRLKYEVESSPDLNTWLLPVFFAEESYDLTSLSNLWEKLLKYLDEHFETGGAYFDATEQFMGNKEYESLCFNYLIQTLHERNIKLLVLFDNFGELFLDNLSKKDTQRFREVLMNCNDMRIVAASAIVLEDQHDYSKPFFEFFKIIYLDGLNKQETLELIENLQKNETDKKIDIKKNKAKIETLSILTGGVIRTILLLYEVLLTDENGSALRDLEMILDRITPLYKHRMEVLSLQQRKIVDVVAKSWDAISVKDIIGKIRENGTRMQGKAISAQLAQLEKNNVIEKRSTTTKNNLYLLKERFFNIWYLMRSGDRYDKCRVVWLTKFLEMWYTDEQEGIEGFIKKHIEKLQQGNYYPDAALLFVEAIVNSTMVSGKVKKMLLEETKKVLPDELMNKLPIVEEDSIAKAWDLTKSGNYRSAIEFFENPNSIEAGRLGSFLLPVLYIAVNDFEKAYDYCYEKYKRTVSTEWFLHAIYLYHICILMKVNKELALECVTMLKDEYEETPRRNNLYYYLLVFLWNNQIEKAIEVLSGYIEPLGLVGIDDFDQILKSFIAKKQYHYVLNLFNEPRYQLKDKNKPLYFALMYFMKDEYPDEYLKMGPELETTVMEIVAQINQLAIDYA